MILPDDIAICRRMRLFDRLSAGELDELFAVATVKTVQKGENLFERGDDAVCFYGVLSGWIKVYRAQLSGDHTVLSVFGPGETFAEAAMFLGNQYPASAEAVENGRICIFSRDAFQERMASNPNLCFGILGAISYHLHSFTLQVEQLKTRNSEQRLAAFLTSVCDAGEGPATVVLPYDKALIAARLGMKPESLSRNLAKLEARGVRSNGETIRIDDVGTLAEFGRNAPYRRPRG